VSDADPADLQLLMRLQKALWKLRPPEVPEPVGSRLVRRWREKRLLDRLERDWPGGFTLHRNGDLVYVPRPLDARGRRALLYPPHVHPAALACLRPGSVAIDVGACLGEWTLPLARAVGSAGRVVAVEPTPRNGAALERTLQVNALRQAELVRCALGDQNGEADLAVPRVVSAKSDTGTTRVGPAGIGEEAVSAAVRTLDSLMAEARLHRVDFIKIDVEGHERRVLDGAEESLARYRPVLVLETGHEGEGDRPAIHLRLRRLGYRMLGLLLDHGMAEADWPSYVAREPPFRAGDAHNLLLVPEE
jgi:FkbM family methyltransferase